MDVEVKFDSNELSSILKNVLNKNDDLTKPLTEFALWYRALIIKNFYEQGSVFGKWEPLSLKYLKLKANWVRMGKTFDGLKAKRLEPLRLTDRLRKALFDKNIITVTPNSVSFTLKDIPYAARHQYGDSIIPARPFLHRNEKEVLSPMMVNTLIKIIEKHLEVGNEKDN